MTNHDPTPGTAAPSFDLPTIRAAAQEGLPVMASVILALCDELEIARADVAYCHAAVECVKGYIDLLDLLSTARAWADAVAAQDADAIERAENELIVIVAGCRLWRAAFCPVVSLYALRTAQRSHTALTVPIPIRGGHPSPSRARHSAALHARHRRARNGAGAAHARSTWQRRRRGSYQRSSSATAKGSRLGKLRMTSASRASRSTI